MKASRTLCGAIVGVLAAVGLATATPASASPATAESAELVHALQRDLGLTRAQAQQRLVTQEASLRLDAVLTAKLGDDYAGSWLEADSGRLVVAVSDPARAGDVRTAGAEARVVTRSLAELEATRATLQGLDPAALAGVTSWRIDPQRNAVVVTVLSGQPAIAALDGLPVRIETTDVAPVTAANLYGGNRYNNCSAGFNAFSGSNRYVLTAGHCGPIGTQAFSNGTFIGPFEQSNFPGVDYAAIRVTNTAAWTQGPWINAYNGGGVYTVNGHAFSPVGTAVCKSGYTTGLTCGVIKQKGESVGYDHDNNPGTPVVFVHGLVRHTACVEQGDSGGANFSWNAANKIFAEGMTSGALMQKDSTGRLRCLAFHGKENVSWFSLVTEAMVLYGLNLYTAP
jgi:streptogrisin C